MKKVNTINKLNLSKEIVAKLGKLELNMVKGGAVTDACETNIPCKHIRTSPVICKTN
jgi:natural product precursor